MNPSFLLQVSAVLMLVGLGSAQILKTDCIDGSIFTAINDRKAVFKVARARCASLDPANNSALAPIRNKKQFDAVFDLVDDLIDSAKKEAFWVGIHDAYIIKPPNVTDRFAFYGKNQAGLEEFIRVGKGNFPWAENEPYTLGGGKGCVKLGKNIQKGDQPGFYNEYCYSIRRYICSSDCPTQSPTTAPTASPSSSPTPNPTTSPSTSPSLYPSTSPSTSPTFVPTTSPTATPTNSPTNIPTSFPTDSPRSQALFANEQNSMLLGSAGILVAAVLLIGFHLLKQKRVLMAVNLLDKRNSEAHEGSVDKEYQQIMSRHKFSSQI